MQNLEQTAVLAAGLPLQLFQLDGLGHQPQPITIIYIFRVAARPFSSPFVMALRLIPSTLNYWPMELSQAILGAGAHGVLQRAKPVPGYMAMLLPIIIAYILSAVTTW